jgi:hypothetical protein
MASLFEMQQSTDASVERLERSRTERLSRSWMMQATGKLAAAAALEDMKAKHITHGERGRSRDSSWSFRPVHGWTAAAAPCHQLTPTI